MSSINTNAAAMTALQTLRATNSALDTTQNRISTGYRVAEASHNAAYWSIATTMRSDNNAMSTVQDALGLGAAQVDIAYTAMDAVKDTLDTMKAKIVAASQPDIDKSKIQEELKQLQNDLKTYASSATFSGGNWLDVQDNAVQKVVASFLRDSAGAISLGTIDVDTSKTALFNKAGTAVDGNLGLLQGEGNWQLGGLKVGENVGLGLTIDDSTDPATVSAVADQASISLGQLSDLTLGYGDSISFTIDYDGTSADITISYDDVAAGLSTPVTDGSQVTLTQADFITLVGGKLDEAFNDGADPAVGLLAVAADSDGNIVISTTFAADGSDNAIGDEGKTYFGITNLKADAGQISMTDFDITDATAEELSSLLNGIDKALSSVTTAASDLGAIKTRISSQQDFVGKIMDAVSRGVGQLVDADMSEESTRLQALQVQQQLGIQALSIANGNAQSILSLFR